jgi:DNA polymerase (family 10)
VQSIDDLRRVLEEHKLRELKGFGAKSEEKLSLALTRLEEQGSLKRTPISVALPHAERIVAELAALPGVSHAAYCGSLRRFCETVGDIDIVVAASSAQPVMDAVVQLRAVDHVLAHGETKTSIVTKRGIQVDVRVVRPEHLGAALLYFTGSKSHNVKLRQRALKRGWTLNEYALTELETGKVIASESEAQIYEALGLAYVPPVLREDLGEVDAAERGSLPLAMGRISGDFHVHTSVSGDGRASLEEMVGTAKARGYEVLAITDHAEGTVSGVDRQALLEQRTQIRALQRELGEALTLLHGVELNIGPTGELDYDPEFRSGFDFCLASVHSHFDLDQAAQTARVTRAMRDPCVRMIGHLTARMIGGRAPIALDLAAVFATAEQTGTALEINGALPRLDVSVDVLRHAQGKDVTFVLTSDAHSTDELALIEFAARNAERAWLDPARVANTWPAPRLREWAGSRR